MTGTMTFKASELCSRKLWQLVNTQETQQIDHQQLEEAVNELASRRRYLAELREIGKLEDRIPGA